MTDFQVIMTYRPGQAGQAMPDWQPEWLLGPLGRQPEETHEQQESTGPGLPGPGPGG